MTRQEINDNIAIAQKYLERFHLLIPEKRLVLDCYLFPPFGGKSFYAQIEQKNGIYQANCAFTSYSDHMGLRSYSQLFTTVESADKQLSVKGDVYCKIVRVDTQLVNLLFQQANEYESSPTDNVVCIDGIYAGARLFCDGNIIKDIYIPNSEADSDLRGA